MKPKIIITQHARQRIRERNADPGAVRRAVRRAVPFAPRWPQAAVLTSPDLAAEPVVKYFARTAVVVTLLSPGMPLKADTEVVHV